MSGTGMGGHQRSSDRQETIVSYLNDLDVEHDQDGDVEIEIENHSPERSLLRERGQEWLKEMEPGRVLDLLGR